MMKVKLGKKGHVHIILESSVEVDDLDTVAFVCLSEVWDENDDSIYLLAKQLRELLAGFRED
jgi:hypothetical protein